MIEKTQLSIRPMRHDDVLPVVLLHRQIFPDYFLTQMGSGVLEIMYSELVSSRHARSFVCVTEGSIVGFVAGVVSLGSLKVEITLRHWPRLVRLIVPRMLSRPALIWPLFKRLVRSFPAVPLRRRNEDDLLERCPSLLSIGVSVEFRGSLAASMLVTALVEQFRAEGQERMILYTFADNIAGNRFFQKAGFRLVRSTPGKRSSNIYLMELR